MAPDLDLGLPHPRGRLAPPRRSSRSRSRTASPTSRPRIAAGLDVDDFAPPPELLLQQPHRLLRGDRQVPRRAPDLGPLDARRYGATDERSLHCRFHTQTAGVSLTAQQPENNIARVAIQALAAVLGGHPEPAHRQLRRGARAPDREGRADRPAHPADHRRRDRRRPRGRPARWLGVRRVDDRRDGAPGRGDLRPPARAGRRLDARRRLRGHRQRLVRRRDRRRGLPLRARGQRRAPRHRRRERLHRRRRGRPTTRSASTRRSRSSS